MKDIKAFTLMEILIAMVVLGLIAAIIVPSVMKLIPDQNKVLFKKAYSTLEHAVTDLVSNEEFYPSSQTGTTSDTGATVEKGFNYTTAATVGSIVVPSGQDKFCYLLAQELNVKSGYDCSSSSTYGSFTTNDGMDWQVYYSAFPLAKCSYSTRVVVDVNGTSKQPNCGNGEDIISTCASGKTSDMYEVGIRYDGKLSILSPDGAGILAAPTDNTISGVVNYTNTCTSSSTGSSTCTGTYSYSLSGTTVSQNDAASPSVLCATYTCGSASSPGTGGTSTYTLSSGNVTKTTVDSLSSLTCPAVTWACGAYGYTYVLNNGTVYQYDTVAYNAGTNLACASWTCGSSTSPGTGYYNYYTSSASGSTVSLYDKTAYSAGTALTCSTCTICGTCDTYNDYQFTGSYVDHGCGESGYSCRVYDAYVKDVITGAVCSYEGQIEDNCNPPASQPCM